METRHYWEENGHSVKYDNSRTSRSHSHLPAYKRRGGGDPRQAAAAAPGPPVQFSELTVYPRTAHVPRQVTTTSTRNSYNSNDGFSRAVGDQLNFAPPSEDEAEYPPGGYLKKGKVSRQDPMSHRIIEKRRRDRMNNCLADLSRLIPPEYLKKGRGRVEKTEIIEMAIRHLKYLQDRANAAERQVGEEHFRAGFQEAVGEAVRFLIEVHGYGPGDGLCVQLASHLQRHVELVTKGEPPLPRDKPRSHPGSSSETGSSSGSSRGFAPAPVISQAPPAPSYPEAYDASVQPDPAYAMECDRITCSMATESEVLPDEPLQLDTRNRKREPTLRTVRKPDHCDDYSHSYKFKNSIERRFSRSQDSEATDMSRAPQGKVYSHKRRRAAKPAPSTSTSGSGSTEDNNDTSPQDTSSESPHHHHYDKLAPPPTQYVPIFALNAQGKYYVPLSVDYACLRQHLGPYDILDARAAQVASPLHPVTINVNFQPCLGYHMKREPSELEWRAS